MIKSRNLEYFNLELGLAAVENLTSRYDFFAWYQKSAVWKIFIQNSGMFAVIYKRYFSKPEVKLKW